jgi:hypothetical protein
MRKLMLLTTATVIACATIFVWSHSLIATTQASSAQSISPTDMLHTYKGPFTVEQWDAI